MALTPAQQRAQAAAISPGVGVKKPPKLFDLGAESVGNLLTMLNNPGTLVGAREASGGSPGYMVSRAGERAASQGSFNLADADRQKVYGEAMSEVRKQAPAAQAGFDANTATMQSDARSRAIANTAQLDSNNADASRAAAALGLPSSPSATSRTAQILAQASARGQANADSRARFNTTMAKTTGRGIERTALAFGNRGEKQREALSKSLAKILSMKGDFMAGGTRGRKASAGKLVGALTNAQRISVNGKLLTYSGSDFRNDLSAAKYVDSKGGPPSRSSSGSF